MFEVPAWSRVQNPFYHAHNTGKGLLITVGDSWTYGDSLGMTRVRDGVDDADYRLNHVYGRHLANQLGVDWTNLALPGASNWLVLNWLNSYLSQLITNGPVVCVITLTESGRHEELRLIDRKLPTQHLVLQDILHKTYKTITQLQHDYHDIKFVTTHNFTDGLDNFAVEKTWLEVLLAQSIQNNTYIMVSEHIAQMNYKSKFSDVLDIMSLAEQRLDLLDRCEHCCQGDSRHPLGQGHQLWAQYLLSQI